ncbi:MAG: ribosomal protein S18-alanine N-acetyltransferase [Vulcanimicrobiota bacterium]
MNEIVIAPMREEDIPRIREIEKKSFIELWPDDSFEREITENRVAYYLTARIDGIIAGYMGTWLIMDESHITTFAVDPDYRGRKVGFHLLWHLMSHTVLKGARWSTLEVNEENAPALHLYEKFRFKRIGKRKEYYANGKNAVVMWVGNLQKQEYRDFLDLMKEELNICERVQER